jgi:cytoskeleton protein RodZ
VYLKGYVRNIAKMVGLDADELAKMVDVQYDTETGRYLPQVPVATPVTMPVDTAAAADSAKDAAASQPAPQPAPQPTPTAQHFEPEPERENRPRFATVPLTPPKPKTSGTMRSVAALLLLLVLLIWLLVHYKDKSAEVPPPPPAPVAQPMASAMNVTAPDNASETLDNASAEAAQPEPVHADMPAALPAKLPPRDPGLAVLGPSAPASAPAPAPDPATASAKQNVPASSIEVTRKAHVAEMRTSGMQQLTITAKEGEVCWVQVNDGQQARSFTLRGGETRQVEFSSRVRVRMGNAGGVTFRLNGQDYPFEGKRGSIETLEFGAR